MNGRMLEQMAAAILPLMDDPLTFDDPLPSCKAESHVWSIRSNHTVGWSDAFARGSTTYRIAIVCDACSVALGLG
jgi:hypothetical protein